MPAGWIPETYDARDKPYRSQSNGPIKHKVNLLEENPGWFDEIYNQFDTFSCVANATSAAYRFLARKLNKDTSANPGFMDVPSRSFVYYNARILEAFDNIKRDRGKVDESNPPAVSDTGSNNRFSLKGLNVYGVTTETSWPFTIDKINNTPDGTVYQEAYKVHALEYCRLDPDHPSSVEKSLSMEEKVAVGVVTLMQLKQCLSEGYPVIFGFWWYSSASHFKEDKEKHEWILPALPANLQHTGPPGDFGGHTVLCVGYDEDRKQVLIQNSEGPDWDRQPRFWMDYSWVKDWEASDDFWMVRTLGSRQAKS